LPSPPPWATVVGRGYRLSASANAPRLDGASISFNYLVGEVPPGERKWLTVYFWDGATWHPLPTTRHDYYPIVSAPIRHPGLYALMTSIEITLTTGFNSIGYPIQETHLIREALRSIEGAYTLVRHHDPRTGQWLVFRPDAPDTANSLKVLEFGKGYEITVTRDIVLRLKGPIGALATGAAALR
jgi:hypothetical protein